MFTVHVLKKRCVWTEVPQKYKIEHAPTETRYKNSKKELKCF